MKTISNDDLQVVAEMIDTFLNGDEEREIGFVLLAVEFASGGVKLTANTDDVDVLIDALEETLHGLRMKQQLALPAQGRA